eukprot:418849-Amphidinium_carterae.1
MKGKAHSILKQTRRRSGCVRCDNSYGTDISVHWDRHASGLPTPRVPSAKEKSRFAGRHHCAEKHYISNSKRLEVGNCNHSKSAT